MLQPVVAVNNHLRICCFQNQWLFSFLIMFLGYKTHPIGPPKKFRKSLKGCLFTVIYVHRWSYVHKIIYVMRNLCLFWADLRTSKMVMRKYSVKMICKWGQFNFFQNFYTSSPTRIKPSSCKSAELQQPVPHCRHNVMIQTINLFR